MCVMHLLFIRVYRLVATCWCQNVLQTAKN